jgi:hypothetical protein
MDGGLAECGSPFVFGCGAAISLGIDAAMLEVSSAHCGGLAAGLRGGKACSLLAYGSHRVYLDTPPLAGLLQGNLAVVGSNSRCIQ